MCTTVTEELIPFVVLFEGRSGSTYLIECLANHPQIRAEKEILAALRKRVERGTADSSAQLRSVEALFAPGQYDYNVVGFKTKVKDILDRDGLANEIQKFGTRIILLQRRNRIKLLVSLMNAIQLEKATGEWNLYTESDRQPMLHIDLDKFRQWLETTEESNLALNGYVQQLHLPTLEVYYEDILMDSVMTLERICSFLGVPHQQLEGKCIKNTSDDLRNVLENFDELSTAFRGTRYEEMFDEVLKPRS